MPSFYQSFSSVFPISFLHISFTLSLFFSLTSQFNIHSILFSFILSGLPLSYLSFIYLCVLSFYHFAFSPFYSPPFLSSLSISFHSSSLSLIRHLNLPFIPSIFTLTCLIYLPFYFSFSTICPFSVSSGLRHYPFNLYLYTSPLIRSFPHPSPLLSFKPVHLHDLPLFFL